MLSLIPRDVDGYLERLTSHQDPVLKQMERQAHREGFPIVGPQVGRLLMLLAKSIRAKKIFEMGSGFGYSALWFAKAIPEAGRVTLTDVSPARIKQSKAYFTKARKIKKAEFHTGDAVKLIAASKETYDIIFLDAGKERYPQAFKKAWPKLRRGGLLITDNVLWSGRAARNYRDAETKGIQQFNRLIFRTPTAVSTVVPLRDGVSVSLKV